MNRLKLLWKFVKLIPKAKEVELEVQKAIQNMHNLQFSEQIQPHRREEELAYQKGVCAGITYCIGKFND